jgi:uncharacterized protein
MQPLVEERLRALAELCRRHHVRSLWLFGSAVGDTFDQERSDLDFVVEFQPLAPVEHSRAYFGLLEDLEHLFGRDLDLLEAEAIRNPYLRERIAASRVPLYVAA